ncbi:metal ion (Mn2+/Fe2+) transporter (Nramp) family metal ion transporter [Odoribacter laneus]|jgi:natural resistance-associated macrophage protein|uniref:Nramp family divalent metal transporter n=1 Tax=Odoribacter laneus TaxID=626933 RepID=UPI00189A48EB|nr:Nramp family divalent metal transporter [Odoribacter laneus]MBS1445911.1 Nramp family divalent metal transporter [Odoribacter sp.]GKI23235.1 metal ion (Mn2+/Fe2+) transporter (Nramp) family metal ion transporter [Odoribacter laneus]GKI25335.1 metal ion (Mn2+/Fe2+) transporter (Nramp) family metal ion transporter [Odoribacter laneus]
MFKYIRKTLETARHRPRFGGLEILRYIGPGLLVTVGFIDPGNWASNLAAGADYGYALLWMVSLSTIMLIILQHNVAHLGIATGLCLSEAAMTYLKPRYARLTLISAMGASISTSLAEILGGAIALEMLFRIPVRIGAILVAIFVVILLFTNSYRVIERWIIAFVSIIGLSFIYELSLVHIEWGEAAWAWVTPSFPEGSMVVIMSVLGAVVMPHNLFLHSEVIQSRQWNLEDDKIIRKQMRYEFCDTFLSMMIGWAINSAMILLAAAAFFKNGTTVTELQQANTLLQPLLGNNAAVIFAVALLFAGVASTITSGMAAGSIFAGIYREPYDIQDTHSRWGVLLSLIAALLIIMVVSNPFMGLIYSQMILSIQLPITIFLQVYLTSSEKVMGKYKNCTSTKWILYFLGGIVTLLNLMLLISFF